jgi:hypothetical protein
MTAADVHVTRTESTMGHLTPLVINEHPAAARRRELRRDIAR